MIKINIVNMDIPRHQLLDEMQTLGQIASTETALFHQMAADRNGLHVTDMKALSVLLQEGVMTAGQISDRLSLTTGAVTSVINRLHSKRLVHRKIDKNDKRKVIITINKKTLAERPNYYESMGKAFEKQLSRYSDSQLAFLVRFYNETIETTKSETAKLKEK